MTLGGMRASSDVVVLVHHGVYKMNSHTLFALYHSKEVNDKDLFY